MPDDPQPSSELASFGEELRREREIRGISLKEISDATKISKRFLEAIERNDHRTLPAPVFTRGFVREYARYLGLNIDEIVTRYNYAAAGDDRIEKSAHLERLVELQTTGREPLPKKGIPPAYARIDRSVYVLALIIIALAGLTWWAVKHKRMIREAAESSAASFRPGPRQAGRPKTKSAAPKIETAPPVPVMMRLVIDVTDDSWVTLDADGKTVINDELRHGEHRIIEAKDSFHFRTVGNAAGLRLALNDVPLPPLGRDGQVIHDRIFDRGDLRRSE